MAVRFLGGVFLNHGFCMIEALFCGKADFALGTFQLPPFQPAVFQHELSPVAGNLQPVGSRVFTRRSDKHRPCPAVVFADDRRVVIHADVMVFPEIHRSIDAVRNPENPLPEIKIMRGLVQQDASAFSGPGCAPGTRFIVRLCAVPVRDNPDQTLRFSQKAALYDIMCADKKGIRALVEHDRKFLSGSTGGFIHLCHRRNRYACRLFRQHMKAPPKSFFRIHRMQVVRDRNQDRFTKPAVHQLQRIFKRNCLRLKLLCGLQPFFPDIADRRDLHGGAHAVCHIFQMARSHISDADYTEPYFSFVSHLDPP